MLLKDPKISVITAMYNDQKYLAETIKSILAQTFKDFEFILVDDGSTDDTLKIAKVYQEKDSRIKIIKTPQNMGAYGAANFGIEHAKGEYIARIDADDLATPTRLQTQLDFLSENPEYKLVGSKYMIIGEDSRILDIRPDLPILFEEVKIYSLFGNPIGHSTIMFEKKFAKEFGFYDGEKRKSQDYNLYFSIMNSGGKIANIAEFLSYYRVHKNNMTHKFKGRAIENEQIRLSLEVTKKIHRDIFNINSVELDKHIRQVKMVLMNDFEEIRRKEKLEIISYLRMLSVKFKDSFGTESIEYKYLLSMLELILSKLFKNKFIQLISYQHIK